MALTYATAKKFVDLCDALGVIRNHAADGVIIPWACLRDPELTPTPAERKLLVAISKLKLILVPPELLEPRPCAWAVNQYLKDAIKTKYDEACAAVDAGESKTKQQLKTRQETRRLKQDLAAKEYLLGIAMDHIKQQAPPPAPPTEAEIAADGAEFEERMRRQLAETIRIDTMNSAIALSKICNPSDRPKMRAIAKYMSVPGADYDEALRLYDGGPTNASEDVGSASTTAPAAPVVAGPSSAPTPAPVVAGPSSAPAAPAPVADQTPPAKTTKAAAKRPTITKILRNRVWNERVGKTTANGECVACHGHITKDNFECAHIVSVAAGGATVVENLTVMCGMCNRSLGARNLDEFMRTHGM